VDRTAHRETNYSFESRVLRENLCVLVEDGDGISESYIRAEIIEGRYFDAKKEKRDK
jgi:hypothetical protein